MPFHEEAPLLATARDAARLFQARLAGRLTETLLIAYVDGDRRLIHLAEEAVGMAGHVFIPVRAIIADALHHDCAGLILAHCHPAGNPGPSAEDIAATRRLKALGAELGIVLHDHLVFAGDECRSFRTLGLL